MARHGGCSAGKTQPNESLIRSWASSVEWLRPHEVVMRFERRACCLFVRITKSRLSDQGMVSFRTMEHNTNEQANCERPTLLF